MRSRKDTRFGPRLVQPPLQLGIEQSTFRGLVSGDFTHQPDGSYVVGHEHA